MSADASSEISTLAITRPRTPLAFEPGLEGIRALAIVGVLLFHAGFETFSGGFLGVSTFFTLSGFLITRLLLDEYARSNEISLRRFYGRRARRLLPASILGLLVVAVFAPLVAETDDLMRIHGDVMSALLYVANWRFVLTGQSYEVIFGLPSPVQHYWSLAIEEQFYILFPPVVLAVLRYGRGRIGLLAIVIMSLILISVAWMAFLHDPREPVLAAYYGTGSRAAELLIGALLAICLDGRGVDPFGAAAVSHAKSRERATRFVLSSAGLVALGTSVWLWTVARDDSAWLYHGGFAANAVLAAVLIVGAMLPGPLRQILSLPPIRYLGRISYGVYIIHWPVFLWLELPALEGWPLARFFLLTLGSVALASASYRWLESPIRVGPRLRSAKAWTAIPAAMAAVGLTVAASTLPWAPFLPHRSESEVRPGFDSHAALRIAVLGNSVAKHVARGLGRWAAGEARSIQVTQVSRSGCDLARGGLQRLPHRDRQYINTKCGTWLSEAGSRLQRLEPDIVVVVVGPWDLATRKLPTWTDFLRPGDPVFDAWLLDQYDIALQTIAVSGAKVAWLTFPCSNISNRLRRKVPVGSFDLGNTRHLNETILTALARERPNEVTLMDLFGYVCPSGRFTETLGSHAGARPDGLHFSNAGQNLIGQWLGPQLLAMRPHPSNL